MLMVYLIALIVGGVLLALTLVLGGDGDAESDAGDGDAGDGDGLEALLGWLPVTSLRFWTFFAAFFGATGTVLSAWSLAGPVPAAIAAVAAGYLSGLMMDRAIKSLRRADSDSSVGAGDVVGAGAVVLVPVTAGAPGKVRVRLKGRSIDLIAVSEEEEPLAAGQHVMVLAMRDDGRLLVTRGDKLEENGRV